MKYDFLFRFDANVSVGAGHLQRVISIIQPLLAQHYSVACIGDFSPNYQNILESENVVLLALAEQVETRCLIIDHYDDLEQLVQGLVYDKLVQFVDTEGSKSELPHIVVSAFGDKEGLSARYPNAKVFTGIEYLTFRQEVHTLTSLYDERNAQRLGIRKPQNAHRLKLLVSLGGTDQVIHLKRICTILSAFRDQIDVTVLSVKTFDVPQGFELIVGYVADFLKRACDVDIVICGVGQTYLELNKIGIPAIGLVLADNQIGCGELLSSAGGDVIENSRQLETRLPNYLTQHLNQEASQTEPSSLKTRISSKANPLINEFIQLAE